ncbi:MAG TPA: DUF819 family protein [Saprospiraceae bacterium]|nr:DUF819 family protein [Saprospiraceae bacterium]HMQ85864.1 DUF819 family protein [Saprospiraceae bacterium]
MILQFFLLVLLPYISRRLHRLKGFPDWLSPIVLCYGAGILMGNWPAFPKDLPMASTLSNLALLLALPILLMGVSLKESITQAKSMLLGFLLCIISVCTSVFAVTYYFADQDAHAWQYGGMLVGMYTGGTPNMQAIGLATGATESAIVYLNTADMLLGALYLFILFSVGHKILSWFLPPFSSKGMAEVEILDASKEAEGHEKDELKLILLAILVIGATLGSTWLFWGNLDQTAFIILTLTVISLALTFFPFVKKLQRSFVTGEYFLLIFCAALGISADFSKVATEGGLIFWFVTATFLTTIALHLLLSKLFGIDRDTVLFTSVAGLYGPAFIGQLSSTTGNKQLLFPGIAVGLLGYAIGNFLGIGIAWLLQMMWF